MVGSKVTEVNAPFICARPMNNSDLGHLRALVTAYFPIGVVKRSDPSGVVIAAVTAGIINGCHAAGITAVSIDKGCGITIVINH